MLFGAISAIITAFFSADSMRTAHNDTSGSRHREIISFFIAGLLWANYGYLSTTWIILIIGLTVVISAGFWEYKKQQESKNGIATVAMIIGFSGAVINLLMPAIPIVIIGWMGIAMVTIGVTSLIHGYATRREGLYPISGTVAYGVLFASIAAVLHSLGEIGHLLPLIASGIVLLLGIVMLVPVMLPTLNQLAISTSLSADPTNPLGLSQESLKRWAEELQKEAEEVKAEREALKLEKKKRKEEAAEVKAEREALKLEKKKRKEEQ